MPLVVKKELPERKDLLPVLLAKSLAKKERSLRKEEQRITNHSVQLKHLELVLDLSLVKPVDLPRLAEQLAAKVLKEDSQPKQVLQPARRAKKAVKLDLPVEKQVKLDSKLELHLLPERQAKQELQLLPVSKDWEEKEADLKANCNYLNCMFNHFSSHQHSVSKTSVIQNNQSKQFSCLFLILTCFYLFDAFELTLNRLAKCLFSKCKKLFIKRSTLTFLLLSVFVFEKKKK